MSEKAENVVALRPGHVNLANLYVEVFDLYRSHGLAPGDRTGWTCLDELYTVAPGQWTAITGTPGAGKSEWLDALLVNLAENDPNWLFAIYSPENFPTATHVVKLVEKRMRKPFSVGITPRMTKDECAAGTSWVLQHFFWLDSALKTPDELIALAACYGSETRKLGVVLDPWNTLDHQRGTMNETDYVSFILTECTKLVRANNAHLWLVVHPAKIPRNKDGTRPVPTPYDISGSAHWYNKADNIITIYRDQVERSQQVELYVQKVRFKHCGHVGEATLLYDNVTGRYFESIPGMLPSERYADPQRGTQPPTPPGERE